MKFKSNATGKVLDTHDIQRYEITGVTTQGKRFKLVTTKIIQTIGINLYRGSKWAIDLQGKRHLLTRVYN